MGHVPGAQLSAAQLSNQVRLRARDTVVAYYDSWFITDDDVPLRFRDVFLRPQVIQPMAFSSSVLEVGLATAASLFLMVLHAACPQSQPKL